MFHVKQISQLHGRTNCSTWNTKFKSKIHIICESLFLLFHVIQIHYSQIFKIVLWRRCVKIFEFRLHQKNKFKLKLFVRNRNMFHVKHNFQIIKHLQFNYSFTKNILFWIVDYLFVILIVSRETIIWLLKIHCRVDNCFYYSNPFGKEYT